jgi:hypothetical protein
MDKNENQSGASKDNANSLKAEGNQGRFSFDLKFLLERVKLIMLSPRECWQEIKKETFSVKEIYLKFLLIMAAISPLSALIGFSVVGMRVPYIGTWRAPFVENLVSQLVSYGLILAMIYLFAMIIEKLAPKFKGTADNLSAFKLVGYSMTPIFVAGFLSLIPALSLLSIFFIVFAVVVFFNGVPVMTSIPADRQLGFTVVSIVLILISTIFVSILHVLITPQIVPPITAY